MLISLVLLLAAMLSWLSTVVPQVAGSLGMRSVTPQDPSTLTLVLIGAGTLGVYFAISRRAWRRPDGGGTIELTESPAAKTEDTVPRRGAA
jgi:hypothetical protein